MVGVNSHPLWVVGDFPSQTDIERGRPLRSKRDLLMRNVLFDVAGAEPDQVFLEVFYRGITRKDAELQGDAVKQRLELQTEELLSRIASVKPKCIVAIGGRAMQLLTGVKADKLKDNRGKVLDFVRDASIKVVPIYETYMIERVKGLLKSYAQDLLRAWNITVGKTSGAGKTTVTLVKTMEQVEELITYVKRTGEFCFDFETTGLEVHAPEFNATMLAVSFQAGGAWIVPLAHQDSPFTEREVYTIMNRFRDELFYNDKVRKTGHNVKYDLKVAWSVFGINKVVGRIDDTMLMKHLYDDLTPNGLKDVVAQYFPDFDGYDEEVGRYKWDQVPFNVLVEYAACDSDLTFRIRTFLEERLMEDGKLYTLYRNLSMSLLPVLTEMEMRGVLIDRKKLLTNIERAQELIDRKEQKMLGYKQVKRWRSDLEDQAREKEITEIRGKLVGMDKKKDGSMSEREKKLRARLNGLTSGAAEVDLGPVNFNSPPQLGSLLYTKKGFGYRKVWDDKKREETMATDKDTLARFDDDTGFITDLMTYRSLSKTKGTYLVGILERLDRESMLHTEYLQHGTATGRLSSRNPNLQNIPDPGRVKWEEAKEVSAYVKGVFTVPEGHTMLQVDYSQAELRLMAMYAGEETMLQAYANGEDIHSLTAAKLNGMTLEQFKALEPGKMKTLRYHAKAGNFGLIYGMSAEGFMEYAKNDYGIDMDLKEATRIRNTFFDTYPRILEYHELYIAKARKFGYVRTLLGRRRHTPEIENPNEYVRSMDERVAVNTPIQGAAAELTLLSMVLLRQRLDPKVRMLNTVHDSIFFLVADNDVPEAVRIIRSTCTNLPTEQYFGRTIEGVSMSVDVEFTKENWKQMQPYEG